MTRINDPTSFFTNIQLKKTSQAMSTSLEKIASGSRINKAADDASGMTIANKMESQLRGIGQSIRNANDSISMNQIADGALGEASSILQRVREKTMQAASDSQSIQSRQALQSDITKSLDSLKGIFDNTSYNSIKLLDNNFLNRIFSGGGEAQSTASQPSNELNLSTNMTVAAPVATTVDSVIAEDSVLKAGTTFEQGTSLGFELTNTELAADITTTEESILAAGTTLAEGSIIAAGSEVGGNVTINAEATTTGDSTLTSGSILTAGTELAAGTTVTTGFTAGTTTFEAGDVLENDVTLDTDLTLTAEMTAEAGTKLAADTVVGQGSAIAADLTTKGTTTFNINTTLGSGSIISDGAGTNIQEQSTIGGDFAIENDADLITDMNVKAGSTLAAQSELATGSTVGGRATTNNDVTMAGDMTMAAGSQLAAGTEIKAGTTLTNDIVTVGGQRIAAGTALEADIITEGVNYLSNSQTMAQGSIVTAGSVFAEAEAPATPATKAGAGQGAVAEMSLREIDVTTQAGAQEALSVIDAALEGVNTQRSNFGSRQNQLSSEVSNLRNSFVNIASAQSSILDVDLAEEIMFFNQMEVLNKAQSFAATQTGKMNKQNMLDLLQG